MTYKDIKNSSQSGSVPETLSRSVRSSACSYKSSSSVVRSEKQEQYKIYHHNVDAWLRRHLHEIPEPLRDLVLKFVRYCRATGVKDVTLYTYLPRIRNLLLYLDEQGIDICEIDDDDVQDFVRWLEEKCTVRAVASIRRYLEVVKKFLRFLAEKEICDEYKIGKVYERVKLRQVEYLPPTISLELIKLVDEFIEHIPDLKYRTLYCILRETGARVGEILRLKLSDIRESDIGFELVLRKSKSKPRTVFVVKYQHVLRAWLDVHPGWNSQDRGKYYLIYGRSPTEPLTRSSINNYMVELARRLGYADKFQKLIGKPYPNPHLLRHIRAYELVHLVHARKLSEKEVRQLMGWKTPNMVDVYVELMPEDLKRAYLAMMGLQVPEEENQTRQEAPRCPRCGFVNPAGARYCAKCGLPLTLEAQVQTIREEKERRVELLKLLKELLRAARPDEILDLIRNINLS